MVNYENGKIYKLVDKNSTNIYYVGSTCATLSKRITGHRNDCKKSPNRPIYKEIIEGCGMDNILIVLICNFPCQGKDELHAEERRQIEIIGFNELCNKQVPGRTRKEYTQDTKEEKKVYDKNFRTMNQDKIKSYRLEYYDKNKQKLNEAAKLYKSIHVKDIKVIGKKYRSLRVWCDDCCHTINLADKSKHVKTNKHKNNNEYKSEYVK